MNKLLILIALSLAACTDSTNESNTVIVSESECISLTALPTGFSIVEESPAGYFVRLSSSERASADAVRTLVTLMDGKFDRIDLCLDIAHERGDEYLSIIDGKVYDYDNDNIYSL